MTHDATVAVFRSQDEARGAIEHLVAEGLPREQISLVIRSLEGSPHLQKDVAVGDQSEVDAAKGAAWGGAFGLLAGLTTLAIPGLGLIAAGGALAMGMTGAVAGAALGSYAGFGLSGKHVSHYEKLLNHGKVLIIVHGNPLTVAQAHTALRALEPEEIHLHAETASDAPEIADTPQAQPPQAPPPQATARRR